MPIPGDGAWRENDMSIQNEASQFDQGEPSRQRRWLVVALLFAITLGGATAARLAAETAGSAGHGQTSDLDRQVIQDALAFEGRLDRGAVHVGGDGLVHLELNVKGSELPDRVVMRHPTDVVVVLDRSGSMGGDPMAKALAAIRELVAQLGHEDRFALVTYSNGAQLAIPLEIAASEARSRWMATLGSIGAGGGTNMAAGLDRAHGLVSTTREAGRVARIIVLSDGHANQGDSSPEGLARRSGRAVAGEYVVSTVGVGEGFDERLMARLADAGTGNFYYVPNVEVLAGIFADEFDAARETVASALEIRIDTPSGIEVLDAAGYPIETRPGYVVIRPGPLFSGQERSLWVTLRVPAQKEGETALGGVKLRYSTLDGQHHEARLARFPAIAAVVDQTQFVASLDKDAVKTHHVEETVNRLRQRVSAFVSRGNYAEARRMLDTVDYDELKSLGIAKEDTESYGLVEKLKNEVSRASAAPAAVQAEVQNQLGKALYEAGTDGRRQGAKR
jgi:Ca-activated chloride channel family protein